MNSAAHCYVDLGLAIKCVMIKKGKKQTNKQNCKEVAQCREQVGVALVQGVRLEAPIGLMILIQLNICDGRCISDHPKDIPASPLYFLPPTSKLHFHITGWSYAVAFSNLMFLNTYKIN